MNVVCAWCGVVLSEAAGPVSHGICASCSLTVERAFHKASAHEVKPARARRTHARRAATIPLPGFSLPGRA